MGPWMRGSCFACFWSFRSLIAPLPRAVVQEFAGVETPHTMARYGPIWPDLPLAVGPERGAPLPLARTTGCLRRTTHVTNVRAGAGTAQWAVVAGWEPRRCLHPQQIMTARCAIAAPYVCWWWLRYRLCEGGVCSGFGDSLKHFGCAYSRVPQAMGPFFRRVIPSRSSPLSLAGV